MKTKGTGKKSWEKGQKYTLMDQPIFTVVPNGTITVTYEETTTYIPERTNVPFSLHVNTMLLPVAVWMMMQLAEL
jgi:hypothetical protein